MTSALINPYRFGGASGAATLVHTASSLSVDNDTWTLNDVAYGAEPAVGDSRHLVLVVTFQDNDTHDSAITLAATLGGSAVTAVNEKITQDTTDGYTGGVWVGIIEMAAGTSGQLIFTITGYSGTMDAYGLQVIRCINLSSATAATTPTGTSAITLNVQANGVGVAGAVDVGGAGNCGAFTGTNAITGFSGTRAGAAMYRVVAGNTTHDSSNGTCFAGATWTFA